MKKTRLINYFMHHLINKQKGFTLIELLVVIAIIGILASVVLASLNSARDKGADSAVKAGVASMRAQAEIFYDAGRTYNGFCANATTTPIIANIVSNSLNGAASQIDVVAAQTYVAANAVYCNDTANGFAVSAALKGTNNSFFCADSTGFSRVTANALAGATDITCS